MQDLFVVTVFHGECDLSEPIKELIFSKVVFTTLAIDCLKARLNLSLHITIISIVHDNAKFSFFRLVYFAETHNIWVIKNLKNLSLVQSFTTLFFAHLSDIDLLDYSKAIVGQALHQVGRTERTCSQCADFLVSFEIFLWFGTRLRFHHSDASLLEDVL